MKNKTIVFSAVALVAAFVNHATAQPSAVSLTASGIAIVFNIQRTSPDAKDNKGALGSVYFTDHKEGEDESRVHRIVADRSTGVYFGYDLVIKPAGGPGKHLVSIRPLSKNAPAFTVTHGAKVDSPEQLTENLTARSLPKYPEDMTIEDGDTIALDILYNPRTKVKIVDLIRITDKAPPSTDASLRTPSLKAPGTSTSAGAGSNDDLPIKQKPRDFTLNEIKLRLTSPKLIIDGAVSTTLGSEWEGIIEGSIIHVYIPGKGRMIFSLSPQDGLGFQKQALIEDNKIAFNLGGERHEVVSAAPILSNGGSWNVWTLHDALYRPDLIFSPAAAGYVEYGASNDVESVMKQEWRKSRLAAVTPQKEKTEIYKRWVDEVGHIISVAEKQTFNQLRSDEEREQFIDSFWRRRDTSPETEENEYRREYYSRVAFANENFNFGKTAGRLTDRGRIYVLYGKPDDVQKSTSKEVWLYNSTANGSNAKFEFVDKLNNGDFRLQ